MNLLHLKYAVIVAETNSMTKAAEMLFTAQPNLSRAKRHIPHPAGRGIFGLRTQDTFAGGCDGSNVQKRG